MDQGINTVSHLSTHSIPEFPTPDRHRDGGGKGGTRKYVHMKNYLSITCDSLNSTHLLLAVLDVGEIERVGGQLDQALGATPQLLNNNAEK